MTNNKKSNNFLSFIVLLIWSLTVSMTGFSQEETKGIQSEELIKKRPVTKKSNQSKKAATSKNSALSINKNTKPKRKYYRIVRTSAVKSAVKSSQVKQNQTEDALLGVTVWKIRPAAKNDAAKELVEEEQNGKTQTSEYTLERMESETQLAEGERIRISVESLSHSGFLYIIDRELYSDGTYSSPKLIYPTLRTKNRSLPIGAGGLVFIPEAPRYFRVKSNQADKIQVAEVLTIIISPKALIEPSLLQTRAIDLLPDQFNDWQNQWSTETTLLEEIDGAGQTITLIEQTAGQNSAKGLTEESDGLSQDDPTPQSVFRSRIKPGNPILVNLLLNFRAK